MEEVLKKLQAISNDLDTLKWEEELKKDQSDKIEQNIVAMNSEIEAAINDGKFTPEGLEKVVETLENANSKIEAGITKSVGNSKESLDSQLRKSKLQTDIKNKYETLFKQKEVIDQYMEKYDPNNIIDIKNSEIKKNNNEIKNRKELNEKIGDFINTPKVSEAVNNIEDMKKKNEQLKKAQKAVNEIEELENKASTAGLADAYVQKYKEAIADKKDKLKDLLKDTGISYSDDIVTVKSEINAKKVENDTKKQDSANQIRNALLVVGDTDLKNAFGDLAGKKPEEVVDALNRGKTKVQGQIANLNSENTRLQGAIDQMKHDLAVEDIELNNISSNYAPISYVPSDDEIENDPDYQAQKDSILVPSDRKDKIAARNEYLRNKAGIGKDDEGAHPIIWFKSHFGTKKLDKEMVESNKSMLKEKIKEKLIKEKQKQDHTTKVEAQTRKDKFREKFKATVVNAVLKGEKDEDVVVGSAYQNVADEMDRD